MTVTDSDRQAAERVRRRVTGAGYPVGQSDSAGNDPGTDKGMGGGGCSRSFHHAVPYSSLARVRQLGQRVAGC